MLRIGFAGGGIKNAGIHRKYNHQQHFTGKVPIPKLKLEKLHSSVSTATGREISEASITERSKEGTLSAPITEEDKDEILNAFKNFTNSIKDIQEELINIQKQNVNNQIELASLQNTSTSKINEASGSQEQSKKPCFDHTILKENSKYETYCEAVEDIKVRMYNNHDKFKDEIEIPIIAEIFDESLNKLKKDEKNKAVRKELYAGLDRVYKLVVGDKPVSAEQRLSVDTLVNDMDEAKKRKTLLDKTLPLVERIVALTGGIMCGTGATELDANHILGAFIKGPGIVGVEQGEQGVKALYKTLSKPINN